MFQDTPREPLVEEHRLDGVDLKARGGGKTDLAAFLPAFAAALESPVEQGHPPHVRLVGPPEPLYVVLRREEEERETRGEGVEVRLAARCSTLPRERYSRVHTHGQAQPQTPQTPPLHVLSLSLSLSYLLAKKVGPAGKTEPGSHGGCSL